MTTPFSLNDRDRFVRYFVWLFYTLAIYKWLNGMWMYQMQPHFFNTRFDGTTWLFMQTGIHQWLLDNKAGWVLFDVLFYSMPLLYLLAYKRNIKWIPWVAFVMLVVNWAYAQCYTLYPTNSIEGHVGWLLYPFVLMAVRLKSFYFLMNAMRYFFLFFFASAAIWKLRQGGAFNPEQMSGILLMQHKEYLVSAPENWFTHFIYWLVKHQIVGYCLYLGSMVLELTFIAGFFTKKYDRLLLLLFFAFLVMDYFIMRIPYFEILPLALPLLFSKYSAPEGASSK
ncbi:MAG: hypothetical protein ABIX01_08645 [Chitinophagaceae bacterium]